MKQLLVSANRWQAFTVHLTASLVVLGALVLVMVFLWFPGPLLDAGGWQGIRLIAAVDLVLGPLITFVVFDPKKKNLRRDLTVVVFIQVSCLIAGIFTVYNQSPAYLVLSDEGLHVVKQRDLDHVDLVPLPETETLLGKPLYIIDMPKTPERRLIFKGTTEVLDGRPFYFRSDRYKPFSTFDKVSDPLLKQFPRSELDDCREIPVHSDYEQTAICVKT